MSLRASIKALVNQTILTGIDDLNTTLTFKSVSQTGYDPITGTVSSESIMLECVGVFIDINQTEMIAIMPQVRGTSRPTGQDINLATTKKALVPSAQLDGINVDALDDQVIINGVAWTIITTTLDPSGALYTFYLNSQGYGGLNAS